MNARTIIIRRKGSSLAHVRVFDGRRVKSYQAIRHAKAAGEFDGPVCLRFGISQAALARIMSPAPWWSRA